MSSGPISPSERNGNRNRDWLQATYHLCGSKTFKYTYELAVAGKPLLMILGESFRIQECLEMQSVENNFASLEHFNPGGHHQQVEVLRYAS